jgi:hypothetical protein
MGVMGFVFLVFLTLLDSTKLNTRCFFLSLIISSLNDLTNEGVREG